MYIETREHRKKLCTLKYIKVVHDSIKLNNAFAVPGKLIQMKKKVEGKCRDVLDTLTDEVETPENVTAF